MKSMGIIQVPQGGKVSWLTKEINDSFVKNELDNIERKIYDMMDEVNFNESWTAILHLWRFVINFLILRIE